MREIKFRCWNVHSKIMHGWDEMVKLNKIHLIAEPKQSYPVMQFTGLKDKNGVDIYEGDIVDDQFNIGQLTKVGYSDELACFTVTSIRPNAYPNDMLANWTRQISICTANLTLGRVIGNIHQNPELLK